MRKENPWPSSKTSDTHVPPLGWAEFKTFMFSVQGYIYYI